jgi:hypothetical protein|tara:strand:- start:605 stop:1306 length:702 start_codon:yes stop_codon:yes gene_type:complete
MADTLETAYANCVGTTAVSIIDGATSTTYTILSLALCQTHADTVTFSIFRADAGASTNKTYIYKNVTLPQHATFEHSDKIVLEASQELWLEASATTNIDCVASYLKQTSPTGDVLKEHSTILNSGGGSGSWAQTTNGGSDSDILPVAATTRTVLSISICNQSTSVDIGFDIGYLANDTSPHRYIYRHQSVPALGTFIHNSKLVVKPTDNLQLRTPTSTANTDLGIVVSYLEQS